MNISKQSIVGEVVAQDYHAASIFKMHGIDFCCKGNRSIESVCESKNIDADYLIEELTKSTQQNGKDTIDYQSWDMDLLADYIEKKHHRSVEKKIVEIKPFLDKVMRVHSDRHPELIQINELFNATAGELAMHMKKEELILFPFVRKLASNATVEQPRFGTVQNPIQMMMDEHEIEGERFRKIAELSDNYNPPNDACATYKVTFAMLKEFEEDLHLHIHLENNILFPRALASEKQMSYA